MEIWKNKEINCSHQGLNPQPINQLPSQMHNQFNQFTFMIIP